MILLLMGGVLLGLDLLRPRQEEKRWLPLVALAGLAGALAAAISLWDRNARVFSVLSCDNFALAVKAIALATLALVVGVSSDYVRPLRNPYHGAFYALLLLSALAIGLAGAATDITMLILALGLFDGVAYILAARIHGGPRAGEAAIKYFLYHAVFLAVLLYGLAWFYGQAGSTNLGAIADALERSGDATRATMLPPLILVTVGLAARTATAPFHQWAADVYEGMPPPVTALLSTAPMIAGFAGLARVLLTALPPSPHAFSADWRTLLMALAVITMTIGNLAALWQRDARRFLAAASAAQAGYILVGLVAVSSPQGVAAMLFALAACALSAVGAVAAFTALSDHTGSYDLEAWAGMHARAPELAWLLILCLLSLAGIPPTAGFLGRLWAFSAAIQDGLLWLVVVGVVNSVITLASIWRVARALFVAPAQEEERLPPPLVLTITLGAAAAGGVAVALFAGPLLALCQSAAQALTGGW